jgi:hypothetical protein
MGDGGGVELQRAYPLPVTHINNLPSALENPSISALLLLFP